jgi:hypothetical protein
MKLVTSLTLAALLVAAPAFADEGCSSEQSSQGRCDVSRPYVSIAATPATPHAGGQVKLKATGSGRGLTYAWDLDDDGEFDDATGAEATRSFAAGTPRVRVRVTDWEDRTAAEARTLEVHAGDRPPSGSLMLGLASPRVGADVTVYADGQDGDGQIARVDSTSMATGPTRSPAPLRRPRRTSIRPACARCARASSTTAATRPSSPPRSTCTRATRRPSSGSMCPADSPRWATR